MSPAPRERRPEGGPLAVHARWLLTAVIGVMAFTGCSTTLTGVWVVPRWGNVATPVSSPDQPTVYVSTTLEFTPIIEIDVDECADSLSAPECEAWRQDMDRAFAKAMAMALGLKGEGFRFEPVHRADTDWRERAREGDLHVDVTLEDLLDRDFGYRVLWAWREDVYRSNAQVKIRAASSGRELANFRVTDHAELGYNYLWFVDIFIPLFPLYISDNDDERADLLKQIMGKVSERTFPVLTAAQQLDTKEPEPAPLAQAAAPIEPTQAVAPPTPDTEGADLAPRTWLDLPNVRLLAVDFYADWCKPCRESIPRWQALLDNWRERGLRVVVVHTQSRGTHATPGWSPDDVVADPYGVLAKSWKVDDRLPQAFLWSWDGQPLASGASIEEIERAVADYFAQAPRIAVAPPESGTGKALKGKRAQRMKRAIRGELTRLGKFDVVANADERKMLAKLRKESHSAGRDDATRCELGREVSPNMLLKVVVESASGQDGEALRLELFGIERSCMLGWTSVPLSAGNLDAAAAEAVSKLLSGLKVAPRLPGR